MGDFVGVLTHHWAIFRDGFGTTIELFAISAIGSLVFGTAFGATYVNVVRNTPLTLIFAFLVFGAPKLQVVLDYFPTACLALTAYTSAFVCEVVRAGVNTVPVGQAEAARALGLTFSQTLGSVVLP